MNALAAYLDATNETQATFARRMGRSAQVVHRICTGKRLPSIVDAKLIEQMTEGRVTAVELLGIGTEPTPPKRKRPANGEEARR